MIKQLMRKMLYGHKATPASYSSHLKQLGFSIGNDVSIYAPTKTLIDESYPWMVSIGNHVRIAEGVTILTHDYSWSVIKGLNGGILGASGRVQIGDNVFIGMHATILRGVTIEDNVIIGSGAVVTSDCLKNGVYAGNPARRIAELSDYIQKRKNAQTKEAKELALCYYRKYQKMPPEEIFHEYFMLFFDKEAMLERPWCVNKLKLCGNYEDSLLYLEEYERPFENYDAFLKFCFEQP